MRWRYAVYLLFSLLAFNVNADRRIVELNSTGNPPLNMLGRSGFLDIVVAEALSRVNVELKIVFLPAERGLLEANNGFIDGDMSRIAGLDATYPNLMPVPEKLMDWEFVAFTKLKDMHVDGWASLQGKSVAIINGWKILERNVPTESELIKVKRYSQLFALLFNDRVDYVVYERWGGLEHLRQNPSHDVVMLTPPLVVKEMYIYLNKKHRDLVGPLALALRKMKVDGSYQKIYNQAFSAILSKD